MFVCVFVCCVCVFGLLVCLCVFVYVIACVPVCVFGWRVRLFECVPS